MTKTEVLKHLEYVDATRVKRGKMADIILKNTAIIPILLDITLDSKPVLSHRAIWALEFAIKQDLKIILPYLNTFTASLTQAKREQIIRPFAKICELLTLDFYSKKVKVTTELYTTTHRKKVAEACFTWLIDPHNVAPQAYSMTSLFLLGKDIDWIHAELKLVLEQNYASGTPAYQARARLILAKIKRTM